MWVEPMIEPKNEKATSSLEQLLKVMAQLRDPQNGCPWDKEQNFATIAPYTIEEAYEVSEAIDHDDMMALKDELGDLLFQVVFHAQMASEDGAFNFNDVAQVISDKMIRRHPHVFGDGDTRTEAQQTIAWEEQKAAERKAKGEGDSALNGVANALPALMRAQKLQKRAARVGFDWPEIAPVFDKIQEEIEEVRDALTKGDMDAIEDEIGDLIFACVNLARHAGVDSELALRRGNAKFTTRFREVEKRLSAKRKSPTDCSIDELEEIWSAVKAVE